ncbi:hypothetical protein LSTR_LSTR002794 [Laodelphax striatellus]|uniref:Uncharacterized protein n=1 Tax=Laodelphax striatellus TaxID=195883 RepID=A0A482XJ94_LAOST|nr:hypothetical protein LSTR_LSTR002794 [Laodelphax striatellus]
MRERGDRGRVGIEQDNRNWRAPASNIRCPLDCSTRYRVRWMKFIKIVAGRRFFTCPRSVGGGSKRDKNLMITDKQSEMQPTKISRYAHLLRTVEKGLIDIGWGQPGQQLRSIVYRLRKRPGGQD